MLVETFNGSSWGTIKQRLGELQNTSVAVLFAQEIKLLEGSLGTASAWALNHGWKSFWAPSFVGPAGTARSSRTDLGDDGVSSGVAIFVKATLGAYNLNPPSFPSEGILFRGRALSCVVEFPGTPGVLCVSAPTCRTSMINSLAGGGKLSGSEEG